MIHRDSLLIITALALSCTAVHVIPLSERSREHFVPENLVTPFLNLRSAWTAEYISAMRLFNAEREVCPPENIFLEACESVTCSEIAKSIADSRVITTGSSSQVYKYGEGRFVVKTIAARAGDDVIEMMINEKAFLTTVQEYVPESDMFLAPIFEIDAAKSRVSSFCRARSYVTFALGVPLSELGNTRAGDLVFLSSVAQQGIELLRKLHATGFVHGDIHSGNFLWNDNASSTDEPPLLHLIDFGLTTPYRDADGNHIIDDGLHPERSPYRFVQPGKINVGYLSPWHIRSGRINEYRPSPIDDLYRFSELLYEIGGSEFLQKFKAREELIKIARKSPRGDPNALWLLFKEDTKDHYGAPLVFKQFYEYALSRHVPAEIDYEGWKQKFADMVPR